MEEIAKALNEYCALLANLKWLQENGKLDAEEDIGALAYGGSLQYSSPAVRQAFVAVMEICKAERACQASLPNSKPGLPYETVQEMQDAIGLAIRNGEQPSFDWLSGDFDFSRNLDYSDEGDGDFTLSVEDRNVLTPYFGMETRLQISSEEVSVCVSIIHFKDGLGNESRHYEMLHDMKDEIRACSDDSLEELFNEIKATQQSRKWRFFFVG